MPPTTPSNVPAFMSAVVATKDAIVPTEVNEEANTSDFNVAPVSVPAAAVTVMAWLPLKSTPFIALAVFKVSAVVAAPEVHTVLSPELVPSR